MVWYSSFCQAFSYCIVKVVKVWPVVSFIIIILILLQYSIFIHILHTDDLTKVKDKRKFWNQARMFPIKSRN